MKGGRWLRRAVREPARWVCNRLGWDRWMTKPLFTSTLQAEAVNVVRHNTVDAAAGRLAGWSMMSARPQAWSLHEWYRADLIQGLDAVIVADVGVGKSSFVKTLEGTRNIAGGGRLVVFDRKRQADETGFGGEYRRLASVTGGTLIAFDPNPARGCHLNLMDPAFAAAGAAGATPQELLRLAAGVAMGAPLADTGASNPGWALRSALAAATNTATSQGRTVILEDVVAALYDPEDLSAPGPRGSDGTPLLQQAGLATRKEIISWGLPVALGLERYLPGGDMAGVFDGPTRGPDGEPLDLDNPLIVLDTSALAEGSDLLAVVMLASIAWLQAKFSVIPGDKTIVWEEAYNADTLPGVAKMQRTLVKRGRASNTAVLSVFHHVSDAPASSGIRSLLQEAAVAVIGRQDKTDDARACVRYFNLPAWCEKSLLGLSKGQWIVRAGQGVDMWSHARTSREVWITDTDPRASALEDPTATITDAGDGTSPAPRRGVPQAWGAG